MGVSILSKTAIAFFFSLIFLVSAFWYQSMAQQNGSSHPTFGLRWQVSDMPFRISLQGFDLEKRLEGPIDNRFPVSQFIRSGENRVTVRTWPQAYAPDDEIAVSLLTWLPGDEPNTDAEIALRISIYPGAEDDSPKVTQVATKPSVRLDPSKTELSFERGADFDTLSIAFFVQTNLPEWCWETGDVLPDSEATKSSLVEAYRKIYALMEDGNDQELLDKWWHTAITENAAAYSVDPQYTRERTSFSIFFENPDVWRLAPLEENNLNLNLIAANRVAYLTTEGTATPLYFDHIHEPGNVSYIEPRFVRRNGSWEICR